jgi:ATP-dependent RNA helicase RhlE
MNFSQLGINEALQRAVHEAGYKSPTPIQEQAIPRILEGGDLIASAQTGTGKTAAFALPILHKLSQKSFTKVRPVRALVLTPTRELASQVGASFKLLASTLEPKLRCIEVFGGVKVESQEHKLQKGCDILVATPGRLLELVKNKVVKLSLVEVLVLDEGDRMLELGFVPDLKRIVAEIPVHSQKMLFSATFDEEIEHLASFFLHRPHRIATAVEGTVMPKIRQVAHAVHTPDKPMALRAILEKSDARQVLVFVNTRVQAVQLSRELSFAGISVGALHGDVDQKNRGIVLKQFIDSQIRVLVATDVAARGLHIPDLPLVVNYEVPNNIDDYVHRIGRTGRAGQSGKAVSLIAPAESQQFGYVEDLIGEKVERQKIAGFKPSPTDTPLRRKEELRLALEEKKNKAIAAKTGKPVRSMAPPSERAAAGRKGAAKRAERRAGPKVAKKGPGKAGGKRRPG